MSKCTISSNKIEMFLGNNKKFIDFDDKSKAIGFAKYQNFYQNCFAQKFCRVTLSGL